MKEYRILRVNPNVTVQELVDSIKEGWVVLRADSTADVILYILTRTK